LGISRVKPALTVMAIAALCANALKVPLPYVA
jgi:hypothetical protein